MVTNFFQSCLNISWSRSQGGWGLNVDCRFGPKFGCRLWSLFDPNKFVDCRPVVDLWLIFWYFLCAEWWLLLWNSSAIHTIGTNFSKPNTLAKYTAGQHKVRLYFSLRLNIFLLQVRNSIFLPPKIVIISCQHLKGNKGFNIQSQIYPFNSEDGYKTDVMQFFLQ